MIPDGYRVVVGYDGESEKFVARVPELGDVAVFAATRGEALEQAEQAIEQAIRQAAEKGGKLPEPVDAHQFDGQLQFEVSAGLHRELVFQAASEGVELAALCQELLAQGLARRQGGGREAARAAQSSEGGGGRSRRGGRRGGRGGGRDYFNIMDDKASFLEYVRGLEQGRGGGGRRGRKK